MTAPAATKQSTATGVLNAGDSAQMGDVSVSTQRDTVYQGVSSEQVIDLLAGFLDKEPQYRDAQAKVIERGQLSTEAKLDRIANVLSWLTTAFIVEAVVLFLVLLVVIQVIFLQLSPALIAGA